MSSAVKTCEAHGPGWRCHNKVKYRKHCSAHYMQLKRNGVLRPTKKYNRRKADAPDGMLHCTRCDEILPIDMFGKAPKDIFGRTTECKDCRHKRNLTRKYGAGAVADKERFLKQQGGVCAICSSPEPGHGRDEFALDHCHNSGTRRGLLCHKCNLLLGTLESINFNIEPFIKYVEAADAPQREVSGHPPMTAGETAATLRMAAKRV